MKQENTNGAKFSRFDVRADYARVLQEHTEQQAPVNPKFADCFYVVAVGETTPPEQMTVFLNENGKEVFDERKARAFDSYGEALKWAVENCEFSQYDFCAVPRGFEKPRFPRVCYVRVYTEMTEL